MKKKQCPSCYKFLPANTTFFHQLKAAKDGLNYWCKKCSLARGKKYKRTEKSKATSKRYSQSKGGKEAQKTYAATEKGQRTRRNNSLKSKYGFTLRQYEQMYKNQKGLCAICSEPETAGNRYGVRSLSVDHNHQTGEVRSLLCDSCNRMIGHAKENPKTLRLAAKYLERHKENFK